MIRFETEVCSSAEDAHALLRRRRDFHVVVLDVVMPDINGDDLLPSLRAILGEQVAVVMASAYGQISLVQRCILRGADSFMSKPLRLESISQLWQQCLAKNRRLFSNPPSECDSRSAGGGSSQGGGRSGSRGPTPSQSPTTSVGSSRTSCSNVARDGGSFGVSPLLTSSSPFGSPGASFPPWHPAAQARERAAQSSIAAAAAAVAAGGAAGWQASARPSQRRPSPELSSTSAAGGEGVPGSPLVRSSSGAGGTGGSDRRAPQSIGPVPAPPLPPAVSRSTPQTAADATRRPSGASAGSLGCSRAPSSGTAGMVAFPLGGGGASGAVAATDATQPGGTSAPIGIPVSESTSSACQSATQPAQAIPLASLHQHQLQQLQQGVANQGDDDDPSGCQQQ